MWAGEPVMERELFSASPRAAQMARARLRLALGAFGSSYSSLLATVHLVLSPPSPPPLVSEGHISEGRERLPHIFTLHKVFCFNTLTSVSHYSCIQMYCTARPAALKSHSVLLLFHCDANQPFLFIDTFVHSKSQNAFLETYVSEALRQYPECLKHSEVFP